MAAMPIATNGPPPGKGVQFRMTVSLGNIISVGMFCVMAIAGWTTIRDNQAAMNTAIADQQKEIHELIERQEVTAELNARQAAIIDEVEKRVNRIEAEVDGKR